MKKDLSTVTDQLLPAVHSEYKRIFSDGVYRQDQQLPVFLRSQTAGHVYTRCLSHMVQSLEQGKQFERAVTILRDLIDQDTYCHAYKGKWFERLTIDLERHLKKPEDALEAVQQSLLDECVKLHLKYNLYVRAQKMRKASKSSRSNKVKLPPLLMQEFDVEKCKEKVITSQTLNKPVQGRKTVFVAEGSDSQSGVCLPVENVAMNHYLNEEGFTRGLHSESLVYHGLFNILMWDQIYAPLEDAFRTHHQPLPMDFVYESFYTRRRDLLETRFDQLRRMSDAQVASVIDKVWNEQFGCQCLVSWDELQLQDVKDLAFCFGVDVLAAIFARLCSNFRLNRSGFPDLILWNPEEKRVKAVEVKGPGDSLSGKQILWIDYFKSCGLDAEVCYVKAAKN